MEEMIMGFMLFVAQKPNANIFDRLFFGEYMEDKYVKNKSKKHLDEKYRKNLEETKKNKKE